MRRPGVAVLSASYDPGWTATVNGRRVPTQMVAPALVAVNVPAGTDHVVFRFRGYGDYPELFALSALTLALIAVVPLCRGAGDVSRHRGTHSMIACRSVMSCTVVTWRPAPAARAE